MPCVGEGLGRNGEIIEEVAVSTLFKLVEGDTGSCFWLAQGC